MNSCVLQGLKNDDVTWCLVSKNRSFI